MQAFAPFLNESRVTESGCDASSKLDARFTHGEHRGVDFLDLHGLAEGNRQSKLIAIELERLVDRAHSDPR